MFFQDLMRLPSSQSYKLFFKYSPAVQCLCVSFPYHQPYVECFVDVLDVLQCFGMKLCIAITWYVSMLNLHLTQKGPLYEDGILILVLNNL